MAKRMSRQAQQRIQEIANHAYAMGAKAPGINGVKAADMSLSDQTTAVHRALTAMVQMQDHEYPYVEDIFDTYLIVCLSDTYWRADYSMGEDKAVTLSPRDAWVEVEEVWQAVEASAAKAGLLDLDISSATPYASMKAVGDRQLDVKVSYYGHKDGKDSHKEYFDSRTDFAVEDFPTPPLLYYHGFDERGKKMGKPVVTGKLVSRHDAADGHHLIYQLKNNRYADLQWDAAQKNECVVSPGTVGHLIRKSSDGHLDYWPLAEISAWDYAASRKPANLHSVAAPVLKALYIGEGISLPSLLAASGEPPETPGDGVSASDPGAVLIDHRIAGQIIANQVADLLLTLHKERI